MVKKKSVLMFMLLAIMLLTACVANVPDAPEPPQTALPEITDPYTFEQAKQNGDVVNLHGQVTNQERWEQFMDQVHARQQDQVRVTIYTIEGDPIIYELNYDGTAIQYSYDNTRDAYAGKGRIVNNACQGIGTMKAEQGGEFYILTGCENEDYAFMLPKL